MNDKLRRAIKTGIIDEDYKDYLAVEKIPHDFSEKYEQRIGELIKTNRKSGHRHIKITLRFAAAIIAAVLAVGSVTVAAVPQLREWFVGIFVTQGASHSSVRFADGDIEDNSLSVANNVMTPDFIPSGYVLSEDFIDDFTHIDFLEQTIGHIPETISCRYNPGGVFKMSNGIMDNPGDAKYGFTHEQIIEGFKILKEKGAKYFGIHAFLASNTVTNEYYPKLAHQLFELVVELRDKTGCDIKFINLSGGVGIPYRPDQTPNDIRVIGEGVREAFEEILVPAGLGDISIYSEMGRFMLGPYGCLVTKAIHEKHTYKEYIGVDACAANLMRPAIYGAYHHITVMGKENEPCDHKYDVTGSLCENCDKFAIDRMLPKIDMGDLLVIHDTGAHGFSMGYNYNGRLRSAEILLKEDGSTQLIRRAETPDDYFATFDCFDILKNMKHPEK